VIEKFSSRLEISDDDYSLGKIFVPMFFGVHADKKKYLFILRYSILLDQSLFTSE
jgi:hypothetical protein